MSFKHLLMAGLCTLALAACGQKDEPAPADEAGEAELGEIPSADEMPAAAPMSAEAAEAMKKAEAYLKKNGKKKSVTTLESGVQVETLTEGEGASPGENDIVTLHYIGSHIDGEVFDSSVERKDPVTESLQAFMPGLREGIMTMKQGGKAKVSIPPEMAFGATGTADGTIGSNEALVFEIDLLEVTDPSNTDRLQELQQEAMARANARFEEQANANASEAAAFLAENAEKNGIMTTASGLQYQVLESGGSDVAPAATDQVEVHYAGTLIDGTEFDSSYSRGETATFGLNQVIEGWTEGLQLMHEGDKYRFFIPPDLAYGPGGKGPIGPNELLIFDVELIDVKGKPGDAAATE